ncbi:MAG TPA: RDD family protein, partial [Puia sp.]
MENSFTAPGQPQDLLTDLTINIERASVGKRFVNYLIDIVVFFVFMFLLGFFSVMMGFNITPIFSGIMGNIVSCILYGIFMGAIEAIFKGKTLGKLITNTRAVYEDGSRISAGTAFARGFSRAVPFEGFSAFGGNPWHDQWT